MSVLQAIFADLVCGNTCTNRHVQPLRLDVSSSRIAHILQDDTRSWIAHILQDDTRSL